MKNERLVSLLDLLLFSLFCLSVSCLFLAMLKLPHCHIEGRGLVKGIPDGICPKVLTKKHLRGSKKLQKEKIRFFNYLMKH